MFDMEQKATLSRQILLLMMVNASHMLQAMTKRLGNEAMMHVHLIHL